MFTRQQKVNLLTLANLQESDLQDCEKRSLAKIIDENRHVQRGMRVGEFRKLDSLSQDDVETVKKFAWQVVNLREQSKQAADMKT